MSEMDLKTRMEVLPCGKCEDMLDCDNCSFQKEAKELYEQIRADVIDEFTKILHREIYELNHHQLDFLAEQLKGHKND